MSNSHTVSDSPIEAPANFASLPPYVQVDDETWHGSGFRQRDVLPPGYHGRSEMEVCGACRSEDTRCIFFRYYHNFVESDIRVEVVCNACGKFTLHRFLRL
jgi:hypothetical protein